MVWSSHLARRRAARCESSPSPSLCSAIAECDSILISAPPNAGSDPVLQAFSDSLSESGMDGHYDHSSLVSSGSADGR
jgi:hypothetical protein